MDYYAQIASVVVPSLIAIVVATRKILEAVNQGLEQFKPNGGSSLRDAIDRIDARISQLEAEFRGHIDLGPGGAFITDEKGECLWVSSGWKELTGLSAEEAFGVGWIAGIHKSDQIRVYDEWTLACRNPLIEFTSTYKTATGVLVRGRAVRLSSGIGKAEGFLGVIIPVSEISKEQHEHAGD